MVQKGANGLPCLFLRAKMFHCQIVKPTLHTMQEKRIFRAGNRRPYYVCTVDSGICACAAKAKTFKRLCEGDPRGKHAAIFKELVVSNARVSLRTGVHGGTIWVLLSNWQNKKRVNKKAWRLIIPPDCLIATNGLLPVIHSITFYTGKVEEMSKNSTSWNRQNSSVTDKLCWYVRSNSVYPRITLRKSCAKPQKKAQIHVTK